MKKIATPSFVLAAAPEALSITVLGAVEGGFLDTDNAYITSTTDVKATRKNSGNAYHPNSFNDQSQDILIDNTGNLGQSASGPPAEGQQQQQPQR
jgi:hypothetical protein